MSRYAEAPAPPNNVMVKAVKETHGLEFVLAALLTVDGMAIPGLGFPYSLVALGLLILAGLRRTTQPLKLGPHQWVIVLLALTLVYVGAVSMTSPDSAGGSDWFRRWLRIAAILAVAFLIATERLHIASILKGLTVGLLLNVPAFLTGLAPDTYAGALTGWVGDKNKAGMYYAFTGVLLLWQTRTKTKRIIFAAILAVPVWLTESRTSMTAYALGLVWTWVVARRPAAIRWGAAIAAYFVINYLETNLSQAGQFADRWGSDLLRERIGAATQMKLDRTPFQGLGLGEAFVTIQDKDWYFHDSFATLRVEGGWPYLVIIVGLTVLLGLRPFSSRKVDYQGMVTQGATLTLLVCALKLGEVYLTIPWGILFGASMNYLLKGEPESDVVGAMSSPDSRGAP